MSDRIPHISDLKLERYLLGELPAQELQEIATRLKIDSALSDRLRVLEDSNAAILRQAPPEAFVQRLRALDRRRAVEAEAGNRSTSSAYGLAAWKPLLGSLALLTILAVPMIGFFQREVQVGPNSVGASRDVSDNSVTTRNPTSGTEGAGQQGETPSSIPNASPESPAAPAPSTEELASIASAPAHEDGIRLKGLEPHLAIFRKTDSGSEPLRPGVKARAGELLRIGYQAGGFPYGAILSVDGNGSVTRHWPAKGDRAGRLENGEALLPSSFELDSAPDYERFYFVVSNQPFDLDPLLESLHKNESLPEPGKINAAKEVRVVRFEILKESGI